MLDFSLLGQGPTFESALKSYGQGQESRRQSNVRNALLQHKDDPTAAAPDLIANGELDQGLALQDRKRSLDAEATRKRALSGYGADPAAARAEAMGSGDMQLIGQIQKMDDTQRAMAAQKADELASVAYALGQSFKSPEERKAWAAQPQNREYLLSHNLTPEQLDGFDWSDGSLHTVIAQATSLKDMLAETKESRTQEFQQRQQTEAERHNREMERIGGVNAGANVTRAKKAGSARSSGAIPALPSGFVIEK